MYGIMKIALRVFSLCQKLQHILEQTAEPKEREILKGSNLATYILRFKISDFINATSLKITLQYFKC